MNSPLLGLDIGLRRTGVAISESGLIALPLTSIEWKLPHAHQLISALVELVRKHEVQTLVVGIPLNEDASDTLQAGKTSALIAQIEASLLREGLNVTIEKMNEFHSSQDADELFPDVDRDAAAAAIILQAYLDEHGEAW